MLTTQNIAIILFFIPVYQLFFYTIQLITFKRSANRARWYLGLLLLSLTLFLIINAIFYLDYQKVLAWSYYLFVPVFLVLIPLFYKYLLSITGTERSGFTGNNMVLFLPAVLILILNIFTYGNLSYIEKLTFLYSGFSIPEHSHILHFYTEIVFRFGFILLVLVQISFYTFKVVNILRFHKAWMEKDASHLPYVDIRWLTYIFISLLLFMVINILFNLIANDHKVSMLLGYSILMIITGALIGYLGMKQENLYEHIMKLSYINSKGLHKHLNRVKERYVKVTNEEKSEVLEALKKLMESKKLYLNSKLTIDELADQLNVNKRIISIVVNDEMGANIYGFINDYRIREFKKIISDPDMAYLSMEGIAEKVGFTSKSSFNASFKKATGKTPSQYRQQSKESEAKQVTQS